MKKRPHFVLLALAAMLAPASCQCSRAEQKRPPIETLTERSFKLPNGLEVDLVAGPCSDAAALVVVLDVGFDHDPPGRSGLARVAERLLSTAAPGKAERSVETGNDYTLYSVVAAGDRLLEELDEVAAWMARFEPTEADLTRSRGLVLDALAKLAGADAAATALSLAEEAVQPARGGGKRRGITAEVQAITLAELAAFGKEHWKPGNARITVTGRFDADKVRAHIEKAFTPLPAGTRPVAREGAGAIVKGTLVMGEAPTAVAMAIPAPAMSDPLYPAFLVQASRLLEKPPQPRGWEVGYDPNKRPELLFITGPVPQGEQPEPGAARIRGEVTAVLAKPLAPSDIAAAKERFRFVVEPKNLEPAFCAKDARAFAIARARRAQLRVDTASLKQGLEATTKEQLDEAAKLFEPKRNAAVIAGGAIR